MSTTMAAGRRRLLVLGATVAYAALVGAVTVWSAALSRALLVANVCLVLSVLLLRRLTRHDPVEIQRLLVIGLALKMAASGVRYIVAFGVYGGIADATRYHDAGVVAAQAFREGDFSPDSPLPLVGTRFIELAAGALYTLIGPTLIGAFVAFACLGYWGSYLFYRAVAVALPDAHHKRYALLLLFPSLLFWPSSLGKDAWMHFALGLAAYGVARFFSGGLRGLPVLAAGLAACALVRPHLALAVAAAFAAAVVVARGRFGRRWSPLKAIVGFAVAAVSIALFVGLVRDYFNLQDVDPVAVDQLLDQAERQTSGGGSSFDAPRARSPLQIPGAVFSVLFRPLPTEARNPLIAVASLEGVFLMFLFLRLRSSLFAAAARVRRDPFIAFVLVYTVVFCVAFSSFGNFGILSRQRVQLFPFLFVLLAVSARRRPSQQLQISEPEVEVGQRGHGGVGQRPPRDQWALAGQRHEAGAPGGRTRPQGVVGAGPPGRGTERP